MNTLISASILNSDMANLGSELKRAEESGADMIHLDVMDGIFVDCITFGDYVVKCLRKYSSLPFDTHLMVHNPHKLIPHFAKAGSDIITIHAESKSGIRESLSLIKSYGLKAGITLNPETPASVILPYIDKADMVLVMTVNPGYGGQGFIHGMTEKIAAIRQKANEAGLDIDIEVDGGINDVTAPLAKQAGANVLVSGSYLFKSDDMASAVKSLKG